jgi:hypothetical protein
MTPYTDESKELTAYFFRLEGEDGTVSTCHAFYPYSSSTMIEAVFASESSINIKLIT